MVQEVCINCQFLVAANYIMDFPFPHWFWRPVLCGLYGPPKDGAYFSAVGWKVTQKDIFSNLFEVLVIWPGQPYFAFFTPFQHLTSKWCKFWNIQKFQIWPSVHIQGLLRTIYIWKNCQLWSIHRPLPFVSRSPAVRHCCGALLAVWELWCEQPRGRVWFACPPPRLLLSLVGKLPTRAQKCISGPWEKIGWFFSDIYPSHIGSPKWWDLARPFHPSSL